MLISQEHFCFLHESDTLRQMWIDFFCAVLKASTRFFVISLKKVEAFNDGLVCRSSDISVLLFIMSILGPLCFSLCPSALFQSRLSHIYSGYLKRSKNATFKMRLAISWGSKSRLISTNFRKLTRAPWGLTASEEKDKKLGRERKKDINSKILQTKTKRKS